MIDQVAPEAVTVVPAGSALLPRRWAYSMAIRVVRSWLENGCPPESTRVSYEGDLQAWATWAAAVRPAEDSTA